MTALGLIKTGGLWLETSGLCLFNFDSVTNFFPRLRVSTFAEKTVFLVACDVGGIVGAPTQAMLLASSCFSSLWILDP